MKYAVLDSGPLIKGIRLEMIGADTYITVPEVLLEIRDRQARERLSNLPFEIQTRDPSNEAIDAIKSFAKLTGDLPALSAVDTRVLALAWMLEKETKHGVEHLRTEPATQSTRRRSPRPSSNEPDASAKATSETAAAMDMEASPRAEQPASALSGTASLRAPLDTAVGKAAVDETAVGEPSGGLPFAGVDSPSPADAAEREAALEARREARRRAEAEEASQLGIVASSMSDGGASGGGASGGGSSGGGHGGEAEWITVENLRAVQQRDGQRYAYAPDASTTVACLTTDYAMQSVLMQMGLKLLGADGMLLRSIKSWVLRCSGCFTQQRTLDTQFCAKCGNASLVRLQAVVDARGGQRLLPEERAPARVRSTNVRGTKYPMPAPKAGRHAHNLILAEDQLAEAVEKRRRQGKERQQDVFDPDYSLDDHFGRAGRKSAAPPRAGHGAPKVGFGKRANPNDVRSRPKRT